MSLFQNWGSFSKIGRGIFFQNKGQPSILEKRSPLNKVAGYLWAWNTLEMAEIYIYIYKIYILQKMAKMTNPAPRSGVKKTLPRIWGHQNQLDDQDKEPMIDTKII